MVILLPTLMTGANCNFSSFSALPRTKIYPFILLFYLKGHHILLPVRLEDQTNPHEGICAGIDVRLTSLSPLQGFHCLFIP